MLRALLIAGAALAAVATVGGMVILDQPAASQPQRARLPPATIEIARTTLVETKSVTGMLGFGNVSRIAAVGAPGTGVVTEMAPVGTTVERGQTVFAVDDRPIPLLYGAIPFFRTLRFEADDFDTFIWVELEEAAEDLRQAELHLAAQQERVAEVEMRLAGIGARLEDSGRGDPQSAEFMHLGGAVRSAEERLDRTRALFASNARTLSEVEAVEGELAAARAGLAAAIRDLHQQAQSARQELASARAAAFEAERVVQSAQDRLEVLRSRENIRIDVRTLEDNLVALGYEGPAAEMVRRWQADLGLPATGVIEPGLAVFAPGPIRVAEHTASLGDTVSGGVAEREPILDYTGVEKLVTVPLDVDDHAFAVVGREVAITLPDRRVIAGVISEIGTIVADRTMDVVISIPDQDALGTLDAANVDVAFVSQRREDVFAVPVTALLALPDGGFAVEVVDADTSRLVPVTAGLFAGGRVEIGGEGIVEGLRVGVPG